MRRLLFQQFWLIAALTATGWLSHSSAQEKKKEYVPEIDARLVLYAKDHYPCRVVITPDNKTIISACAGFGGIRFWDVEKKREREVGPGHNGRGIHGLALSLDGKLLASGGFSDRTVLLWDVASAKKTKSLGEHVQRINFAAFTPDGKLLTASHEGDIKVWDVVSGKETRALFGRLNDLGRVDLSPDGKLLALSPGPRGALVTLWDVATDKARFALKDISAPQGLGPVRFSPDSKYVAVVSGNSDPTLGLWDVATGKPAKTVKIPSSGVHSLAFSPDGKRIALSHDNDIRLWDIATGKQLALMAGHTQMIEGLVFSADGRTLVSGGRDGRIRLWDMPSELANPIRQKQD